MYMESSSPAVEGNRARLMSAVMTPGPRCMNMAYSMYGQGIGKYIPQKSIYFLFKIKQTNKQKTLNVMFLSNIGHRPVFPFTDTLENSMFFTYISPGFYNT